MKLTRRQLLNLAKLLPTQSVESIVEIAEFIEDNHTLKTIETMLNDGRHIQDELRIFYEELVLGGL